MSDSEVEGPVKRQKTSKTAQKCYDCGSSHWRTLKNNLRDEDGNLYCRKCFLRREEEGGDSPHYSPTSPSYAPTSPQEYDGEILFSPKSPSYEEPNTPIPEEPLSPTSPIPEHQDEYPEEELVEEEVPQPVKEEVGEPPVEEEVEEKEPVEEEVEELPVEEEESSALPVPFYEPDDEEVVQLEEANICSRGERLFTCPRCRLQVIVQNLTGVTVCLKCKAPVCLACGKLGGHPGYSCV